ncbi:MAG: alpha/beta fold hydrolase [Bacteroidetes bacterium]|nr:alpha/beta fold hydrolase [Bacteroidota bacterium]
MKKTLSVILLISLSLFIYSFNPGDADSYTPPDGKFITVNGYKYWVETEGQGEPIFFIPGGPGNNHAYLHAYHPLKDSFMLVYIDFLGRGKTDTAKTKNEYTVQHDVDDMEALRKALKFEKITVLGHSYGSLVAQAYAIKYPQNTKRLIIANGFHSGWMWQENCDNTNRCVKSGYPEVWEKLMKIRSEGAVSQDASHQDLYGKVPYGFLYCFNPTLRFSLPKDHPTTMNTALYYQMVGRDGDFIIGGDLANFDVRKQLINLQMPVLIMAGRYDRVSTPEMAMLYKKYCPQAELVMFERSGHNPQVEEPEKTMKIVKAFLKK